MNPTENQTDLPESIKPEPQEGSRFARSYRLTDEAKGKVIRDLGGRTYSVNQDGSMKRLDKPLSKKARRRLEARNGR